MFIGFATGFPVVSEPHLNHLKYVLLGFGHGITTQIGNLDD